MQIKAIFVEFILLVLLVLCADGSRIFFPKRLVDDLFMYDLYMHVACTGVQLYYKFVAKSNKNENASR
jgi:hypothetical protein